MFCLCFGGFACLLFWEKTREWNGWDWFTSARLYKTSWPAVTLLRGECVSGSTCVLPNCVFYGRSKQLKKAWGRIREICMILEIGDKGRRRYIRAEAAIPYLKKLVNWSNRVLNVAWPLLTEISIVCHGLEVPGRPLYLVDSPSTSTVTQDFATEKYSSVVFPICLSGTVAVSDKMFSNFGLKKRFLVMWCWFAVHSHH